MSNVRGLISLIVIIIVLIVALVGWMQKSKEIKKSQFCGQLIDKEKTVSYGRRGRTTVRFILYVETSKGKGVAWLVDQWQADAYKVGDYFVKIEGDKVPAVFRDGKQLKGKSDYLDKDINLEEWKTKIAQATIIPDSHKVMAPYVDDEVADTAEETAGAEAAKAEEAAKQSPEFQAASKPAEQANQIMGADSGATQQSNAQPAAKQEVDEFGMDSGTQSANADTKNANAAPQAGGQNTQPAAPDALQAQNGPGTAVNAPQQQAQSGQPPAGQINPVQQPSQPTVSANPAQSGQPQLNQPASQPPAQVSTSGYNPFDASTITEANALKLIQEADQLWKNGDKQGAIKKSEDALMIRKKLYGEKHNLVITLQNQLNTAKSMAK